MPLVPQTYEQVPVGALCLHPDNPRLGDVEAIAESIATNGFYGAVVAQRSTGRILVGKHRWLGAQHDGLDTVPVLWLDVDDDRAKRILLADNRTGDLASYDTTTLLDLLDELALSPAALAGTGFDPGALDDLRASVGDLVVLPPTDTHAAYAETPDQEDQRAAALGQQPTIHQTGMRELILVYRADEHAEAARLLADLRRAPHGERYLSAAEVVLAALRLAHQSPADLLAYA